MSRAEFTKATKRLALKRSGGLCEATDTLYGLEPGKRCNMPLANGVEFDHVIQESNSHDNSLENCIAACVRCNQFKAHKYDTPRAAKTLRQQDKHNGIKGPKRKIPSRPFQKWAQP